jgi:hypothetical protein
MTAFDLRQAQLFVDDALIAHQTLLERVVHSPVRSRHNPLLEPEMPWEGSSIEFIAGVYRDEASGQFRLWYVTQADRYPGYRSVLCLATSADGVHWERPMLDFYRDLFGGPSNVVHVFQSAQDVDGPAVLYDPDDTEYPWKLVHFQRELPGVFIGYSADGLRWTIPKEPDEAILPNFGDRTTAFFDRGAEEPHVILSRDREKMQREMVRCIYRIGSPDGKSVSSPSVLALRPDLEDGPYVQFYQMSAFRYESLYLGMIERYHTCEPPYADIELTCSRDGRSWQRIRPRTAFFAPPPNGRELGAFDYAAATFGNSPPILHEGALCFYYYGGPSFHGDRFMTHGRCMGLAKLRPDGFVSLRAGRRQGELTTRPFTWPGGALRVNYRVLGGNLWKCGELEDTDGWLRVEVLDEDGNVVPGYSRAESVPLYRDAWRSELLERNGWGSEPTWSNRPQDLDTLIGKRVALRFLLRNAEIFAFRAVPR